MGHLEVVRRKESVLCASSMFQRAVASSPPRPERIAAPPEYVKPLVPLVPLVPVSLPPVAPANDHPQSSDKQPAPIPNATEEQLDTADSKRADAPPLAPPEPTSQSSAER
ncbi:unnamed protein product [Agarophyton chilense]